MLGRILSFVLATIGVLLTCGGVPLLIASATYGVCAMSVGIACTVVGAGIGIGQENT